MAKLQTLFGKVADLFRDDETPGAAARSVDRMTPEQIYQQSLDFGMPREKKIERKLDMSKVTIPT